MRTVLENRLLEIKWVAEYLAGFIVSTALAVRTFLTLRLLLWAVVVALFLY